jgi:hypothetical protein
MPFAWLQSGSIILPPLPRWQGPMRNASIGDTVLSLLRFSPGCKLSEFVDARYCVVPLAGLPELIKWARKLQFEIGGFKPDARDCDDFADAFDLAASWQARSCNVEAAPVVGCIVVRQVNAWADVPAGGRHALNCVETDDGTYIVEPQNGLYCPIALYPNRAHIESADGF